MWWRFTSKIQKHDAIASDETVHWACYGLGGKIVAMANRSISPVSETWSVPTSNDGLAAAIDRSGIVALTDRRLCFFAKRFAIGRPKSLTADWPHETLEAIEYEDDTLTISFADGSSAQLHVPSNQSPGKLIAAFEQLDIQSTDS